MNLIPTDSSHWQQFYDSLFVEQEAFGSVPQSWAERLDSDPVPPLSNEKLTRHAVQAIARDPKVDVAVGYLTAMAWGLQGFGPTKENAKSA